VEIGLNIFEADVDVCEVDIEASQSFNLIASSGIVALHPLTFRDKCNVSDN
jgi:hypothetical protein